VPLQLGQDFLLSNMIRAVLDGGTVTTDYEDLVKSLNKACCSAVPGNRFAGQAKQSTNFVDALRIDADLKWSERKPGVVRHVD